VTENGYNLFDAVYYLREIESGSMPRSRLDIALAVAVAPLSVSPPDES